MRTTNYTETEISLLKLSELAEVHNAHAKAVGVPFVKRFGGKQVAVRRTWAVVELAQERAGKVKPSSTSRALTLIQASEVPVGRKGMIQIIYSIAKRDGVLTREELIARVLSEYTPPRSTSYDRAFVMGYIAHAIREGFLEVTSHG
jgi:hypothetical protein